jgi:hypothetical protein
LVIDLEPALGVRLAADLSRRGLANVVLVLPRWPHEDAVLPTREILGMLLFASRYLETTKPKPNVAFVLDAERQVRIPRRPAADPRVDNRYPLSVSDLPSLATLREGGIRRVVKVTRQR